MNRTTARVPALLMAAMLLGFAPRASAELTKDECIAANRQVQSLRRAEKLREARDYLKLCLDPQCPALVRSDCFERLAEIDRVQPTIVFDAKDASGRDVSAVTVTMDGRPFTDDLKGAALAVDPGPHVFEFHGRGEKPVEQSFVIKESEKERRERIVLSPLLLPSSSVPYALPTDGPRRAPLQPASADSRWKTIGLASGAVGLASIAVAAVFGAMASSAAHAQRAACNSSACTDSDRVSANQKHRTAVRDASVADVSAALGGLLLVGGAISYFASPSAGPASAQHGLRLSPRIAATGGTVVLSGSFE